jgi:VWFA-related protein
MRLRNRENMLPEVSKGFFAAALLSLTLGAPIAFAQTDLSEWPQVRIGIFVSNDKGNSITGLTPDAFLLKENGRPQTVTSLSAITEPQSVCVLIDTSGSMYKSTAIEISAASRFIQNLPTEDEVCVATFAGNLNLEQRFTTDRSLALAAVNNRPHSGGSAIYDSIALLKLYMQNSSRFESRAMVVFTDGVDNASSWGGSGNALGRLITQLAHDRSPVVHMIRIFKDNEPEGETPSSQQAVLALTEIGGGLAYFPRNQRELNTDIDDLCQAMKTRTMLVYTTDNPADDGRERHLSVHIDKAHGGNKLTVSSPKGYYAPSE